MTPKEVLELAFSAAKRIKDGEEPILVITDAIQVVLDKEHEIRKNLTDRMAEMVAITLRNLGGC